MGDYLNKQDDNHVRSLNNLINGFESDAIEQLYSSNATERENGLATYIAVNDIKNIINENGDRMKQSECDKMLGKSYISNYAKEIKKSPAFKDATQNMTAADYDKIYESYKAKDPQPLNNKINDYKKSIYVKAATPKYNTMGAYEKQQYDQNVAQGKAKADKTIAGQRKKEDAEAKKKEKEKKAREKKEAKEKAAREKKEAKEKKAREKAEAKKEKEREKAEKKRLAAEAKEKKAKEKKEAKEKAAKEKAEAKRKAKEAKEAPKKREEALKKPVENPAQKIEDRHNMAVQKIDNNASLRNNQRIAQYFVEEQTHRDLLAKNDGTLTAAQIDGSYSKNFFKEGNDLIATDKFQQYYNSLSEEQIKDITKNPENIRNAYDSYQATVPVKKEEAPKKEAEPKVDLSAGYKATERTEHEKAYDDAMASLDGCINDYQANISNALEKEGLTDAQRKELCTKNLAGLVTSMSMKEAVNQNSDKMSIRDLNALEDDSLIESKANDFMKTDAFKKMTSNMKLEDFAKIADDMDLGEAQKFMDKVGKNEPQKQTEQAAPQKEAAPRQKSI